MNEIIIAVQEHRRLGSLRGGLNRFPLVAEHFKVVNNLVLAHPLSFCAHQQAGSSRLDQNRQSPKAIALGFFVNTARNVDPLSTGLEYQKAARQGNVACEPRPLAAGGLFHDLHQSFLAWLE